MLTENQKREAMLDKVVRESLGITVQGGSQIGVAPRNEKARCNGLDDIDREAIAQGRAEGALRGMRPRRKHIS